MNGLPDQITHFHQRPIPEDIHDRCSTGEDDALGENPAKRPAEIKSRRAVICQARLNSRRMTWITRSDGGLNGLIVQSEQLGKALKRGFIADVAVAVKPEWSDESH